MDAKFSTNPSFPLTGRQLFWLLTVGATAAAVTLDSTANRLPYAFNSLTVPLVLAMGATAAVGAWAVPLLRRLKTGQFIREDGPQSHLSKAGTPTMGGVFFIPTAVVVALLVSCGCGFTWSHWSDLMAVSLLTLGYGAIGWVDDWQVLRRRSNKGITPRTKLLLQVALGAAFCVWLALSRGAIATTIALPLGLSLPLGVAFWPFAGFAIVGGSNATNLTDGLDGLAGGTAAIAFLGMGAIVAPTAPELGMFCAAIGGACLGFLAYNRNPARVFMGDTGSLALGAALAAVGLMSGSVWSLILIGGLFTAETLSVVLQVSYYKATKGPDGKGKRLFRMAPLHHHFELSGWSELRVVASFYLVAVALVLLAFAFPAGSPI